MSMLIHISIPAREPERVANVLAELMGCISRRWRPCPGAYAVFTDNEFSTAIEVYPEHTICARGKEDGAHFKFERGESAPGYSGVHAALSVKAPRERIFEIAKREGWRAVADRRGGLFNLVEFWIEDRFMLELIPEKDLAEAVAALRSDGAKAHSPDFTLYVGQGLEAE